MKQLKDKNYCSELRCLCRKSAPVSSSCAKFTLRLWDQSWVKCSKLRLMIGLLQEILCFWSFTKVPRYLPLTALRVPSVFLLLAVEHNRRMGGWVCKHGCYLRFIYLKSTYKLQALWSTELGSWLWAALAGPPAASGPVRPSYLQMAFSIAYLTPSSTQKWVTCAPFCRRLKGGSDHPSLQKSVTVVSAQHQTKKQCRCE